MSETTPLPSRGELADLRVAAGIALLDHYFIVHQGQPEWRDRLDRDRLDVADFYDCPLGQLFGRFGDGLDMLAAAGLVDLGDDGVTVAHGFDAGWFDYDTYVDYDALTAAWQRALAPEPGPAT